MDNSKNNNFNFLYALSMGMGLGFAVAVPLVLFLFLGVYMDRKFNTMPLFLIISILIGLAAAGLEVRNMILPFIEKRSQKNIKNNNSNNK
jgi:F0F1-type ATP synthase assembly protein I